MYPRLSFLLLPYVRRELPGWGHLLNIAGAGGAKDDHRWVSAPAKTIKGKGHGYWMRLNLSNWSDRASYFLGRYYQIGIQLLLQDALRPGDRAIDVGANVGMVTLCAAALVTDTGKVESFEPNPECVADMKANLAMNGIEHVNVHNVGLSDTTGNMTLTLASSSEDPSQHSGAGTLAPIDASGGHRAFKSFEVPVLVGDDVIMQDTKPVNLIKIDVEGFEFHVLQGLTRTLETWHPLVVTEFLERHLLRAGTTKAEILDFMTGLGYEPFGVSVHRHFLEHRLHLIPFEKEAESSGFDDVLWLHPSNSRSADLRSLIRK